MSVVLRHFKLLKYLYYQFGMLTWLLIIRVDIVMEMGIPFYVGGTD